MKIKAYELRTKKKDELLKQLEELKSEIAQVRRPPTADPLLAGRLPCTPFVCRTLFVALTQRSYSFAWRK